MHYTPDTSGFSPTEACITSQLTRNRKWWYRSWRHFQISYRQTTRSAAAAMTSQRKRAPLTERERKTLSFSRRRKKPASSCFWRITSRSLWRHNPTRVGGGGATTQIWSTRWRRRSSSWSSHSPLTARRVRGSWSGASRWSGWPSTRWIPASLRIN